MAVELVQRTVPAAAVLVAIGCTAQPFLAQDQLGLVPHFVERERDEALPGGIAFRSPGEAEASRPVDTLENTGGDDPSTSGHSHLEPISAADMWLERGDVAIDAFRPNPGLPLLARQPGIEYPGRRRLEQARDHESGVVRWVHGAFSFRVLKRLSRRSRLPLQNRRLKSSHSWARASVLRFNRHTRCLPRRSLTISAASSSTFR